ncbi:MAG: hypothetical protein IJ139_00440 [Bacteroidaceae bacterium]|nr:hypothetical protein [Bacteroidaceae bacterium]MBQ9175320.1 hypothetical protein [Bacteroidaceae bacterium]MBR1378512.1 hypothetical protein [Bacteroidaceae bacterium]
MSKLQRILMITSLCFLVVCLGGAIWASCILHDPSLLMYAAVFALAIVWFSVTIYKSRR